MTAIKKLLLTGHSRGLGQALAKCFAAQGFEMLLLSRGESTDPANAPLMREVAIDLSDLPALRNWLSTGEMARFVGNADQAILINNAAIVEPVAPPGRQGAQAIAQSVSVNVGAPFLLTDAFVEATQEVVDRRVCHISSGAGRRAISGWSVYGATKAALDQHARIIASEHIAGLRISSLAPGVIDTAMQARIRESERANFPDIDKFIQLKTQQQLTSPDDAAARIVDYVLSQRYGSDAVSDIREV